MENKHITHLSSWCSASCYLRQFYQFPEAYFFAKVGKDSAQNPRVKCVWRAIVYNSTPHNEEEAILSWSPKSLKKQTKKNICTLIDFSRDALVAQL